MKNTKQITIGLILGAVLIFAGIVSAELFTDTSGNLSTGSLTKGLVFDMPLTSKWLQSSTVASDRAASHNHGTVNGATVGAVSTDFDGTTDDISIPGLITTLANDTVGTICVTSNVDTDNNLQNTIFALGRDADSISTRFLIDYRMNDNDEMDVLFNVDGTTQWRWSGVNNETDDLIGVDLRFCVVQDGVEPKIYFNGVENTSGSFTTATDKTQWFDDLFAATDPPDSVNIGTLRVNGADVINFNGQMNGFRIWDRNLSAAEILLDYEARGRTLTTGSLSKQLVFDSPLTSRWLQSSTVASDKSANHDHTTVNGGVTFGVDGATFDGSTGYLKKSISDYRINDSSGSIEAWITPTSIGGATQIWFTSADESGSVQFLYTRINVTGELAVSSKIGATQDYIFGNTVLNAGQLYHLVVTSNGSRYKLYVNGVDDGVNVGVGTNRGKWFDQIPERDNLVIGAYDTGSVSLFTDALISQVKIYSRELSSDEVLLNFELGSNGRSLSTGSLTKGLVGHWPSTSKWTQSTTVISDKSAAHNHMTLTGTPPTAGAISVDYNGSSDYSRAVVNDYRGSDSAGSVLAWINVDNNSVVNTMFISSAEATATRYVWLRTLNTGKLSMTQRNNDSADEVVGDTALANDTWYHVVVTSDGSAWKLYLNGSEDTPYSIPFGSNSGDWFADTSARDNIAIGAAVRTSPALFFDGEVADVEVFSRELSQAEIQLHFEKTCHVYSAC